MPCWNPSGEEPNIYSIYLTMFKSKSTHEEVGAPQEVVAQVIVQDVGASEEDSNHESVYSKSVVVEVREQKPPHSEFDPKLGELFTNMHICLVHKALRQCVKDGGEANIFGITNKVLNYVSAHSMDCYSDLQHWLSAVQ